jgi:hypothetical protein
VIVIVWLCVRVRACVEQESGWTSRFREK